MNYWLFAASMLAAVWLGHFLGWRSGKLLGYELAHHKFNAIKEGEEMEK